MFRLLAAALALSACSRPPDEERLRGTIESMRAGAEARRAAAIMDAVAAEFTGQNGEVDREGLARIVKLEFLRNEAIGVAIGPIAVEIDGDRATARFDMTLGDPSRRWLPSGGETFAVVSGWRREGSRWLCYNATWTTKD